MENFLMLKIWIYVSIYSSICSADNWRKNEPWTEEKESRRLQMIKEEEKKLFKLEMSQQPGYSSDLYDDKYLGGGDVSYEHIPGSYGLQWGREKQGSIYTKSPQAQLRNPSPQPPKTHSLPLISIPSAQGAINKTQWCFYCTSPLRILSSDLQRAIENLLNVRRTQYPSDAIVEKCANPENINALPKQQCLHSYCQTLALIDHQTATVFTMRGCAENFAAVNVKMLESREDNTCQKLHATLDLQECICKYRKYCYKGAERKNLYINDDSNVLPFVASGSYAKSIATTHKIFNTCLTFILTIFICLLFLL